MARLVYVGKPLMTDIIEHLLFFFSGCCFCIGGVLCWNGTWISLWTSRGKGIYTSSCSIPYRKEQKYSYIPKCRFTRNHYGQSSVGMKMWKLFLGTSSTWSTFTVYLILCAVKLIHTSQMHALNLKEMTIHNQGAEILLNVVFVRLVSVLSLFAHWCSPQLILRHSFW